MCLSEPIHITKYIQMLFGCQCHNILGKCEQLEHQRITRTAAAVSRGMFSNSVISQLMLFYLTLFVFDDDFP